MRPYRAPHTAEPGLSARVSALAERLAPAAGLRNRLVHEYDAVNDAIVLEAVRQARRDFTAYVVAIEQYLTARER